MWWRRLRVILRRMGVGVFLGMILTAIALVLGWLLAGDWVAERLASYANTKFFTDRNTRLSVGRVTGSVFSDMVFERVRIEREVDGHWLSGLWAERVEARYDLLGLLRGRPDFSSVRVFSPVIELSADSTGRIILPIGNRPGERGGGGLKSLTMNDIAVQDGVFRFSGRLAGFEANHLFAQASLEIKGGGVDLKLGQASMELLDPIGKIEKVSGRITVAGRTIEGKDLSLLWEGSGVAGSFRWNPADSLGGLAVNGTFDRLDLGRIRRVVEIDVIPKSGIASGHVTINGIPGLFNFQADLSGMWGHLPVDTLRVAGTRNGSTIGLERLRLLMADYDIENLTGSVGLADGGRLDVRADFNHVQLDSVPLSAVNWIEGRTAGHADVLVDGFLKSEYRTHGDIRLALGPTEVFRLPLAGVDGRVVFAEGSDAVLEGIDLHLADGGHVALDGAVHPDGALDLDVVGDTGDWSQLAPIIAVPGLAGAGRAAGRVTGTGQRPVIDVAGTFTGVRGWGLVADSLAMERLTGPVLPKPELEGLARTRGLVALGRKLERVDLAFAWKEPRLTLNRLDAVNADTTASATGWADFDPPREAMRVNLSGAHLAMGRFDWISDRDLVVTGLGTRYVLEPARWTADAGSATVSGIFDTGASRMDVTFADMDIDLLVLSGPDAAPEFGGAHLGGLVRLAGPNADPDPSGSIVLTGFRWRDGTVDSMTATFTSSGRRVDVSHAFVGIDAGTLVAAGSLDLPGSAWNVFNDWMDKKEVPWGRVDLHDMTLDGAGIELDAWQAFQPPPEPTHGTLRGQGVLNGPLAAPAIAGQVVMTDFRQGRWSLDSLAVSGDIRPEEARFDELVLADNGHSARVTGRIPLRLALYPWKLEQPARPMDVTVDLAQADLSLLPPAQFGLEEASGDIEGRIRLTGTASEPRIDGELRVTGGTVRPKDREEVIEQLAARVVFEGDRARLVELSARQGTHGTLTGSGTLPLGSGGGRGSTLTLNARNVIVRQSGEYGVQFDGDFVVDLVSNGAGGLKPITRGTVHVDRAEIIRELNQTTPPAEPGQVFEYDLSIDAPAHIYVVNSTVDMELSADVEAVQTTDRFTMTGTMTILRGYYTMLLRRFNITSGTLSFANLNAIDPNIDITAETNDAEYIITVVITGQASNPRLSFSARRPNEDDAAPLTEQQILNRLAPGSALAQNLISGDAAGYDQAGIDVLAGSAQLLFGQVQRDLARMVGVDELRYDTPEASLPGEDQSIGRLTVTKSVRSNVTLGYSQELGSSGNELSVEYRLGRLLFLRGEVARRRATELREEYGIDLRLWHEY
jgi:hypothetical protein